MALSTGARTPSVPAQVMALCHAVPKIPAKPSVLPGSLIYKPQFLPTPSESTLPQLLIPLYFNSCISNTYRKHQGGGPHFYPKVWQLVTSHSQLPWPTHERPQPQSPLCFTSRFSGYPGGGGCQRPFQRDSHSRLFAIRPPRATDHGSLATAPLVPRYRCAATRRSARITVVTDSSHPGKHIRPRRCLMQQEERTSGSASADCQTRSQGDLEAAPGSREQEGLGPTFLT
jgi:hypothetical protein